MEQWYLVFIILLHNGDLTQVSYPAGPTIEGCHARLVKSKLTLGTATCVWGTEVGVSYLVGGAQLCPVQEPLP